MYSLRNRPSKIEKESLVYRLGWKVYTATSTPANLPSFSIFQGSGSQTKHDTCITSLTMLPSSHSTWLTTSTDQTSSLNSFIYSKLTSQYPLISHAGSAGQLCSYESSHWPQCRPTIRYTPKIIKKIPAYTSFLKLIYRIA